MFVTACWTILACVVLDMATCTCHSGFGFETPKPAPASRGRAVAHWCLLWCALDCFGGLWLRDFDCASYANFFSRCLGWSGQGDFSARRGTVQAGASGASLKSFSLWNEDKWIVYECLWYVSEMNEMNEAWIVSQNALAESHVFFHFIIYIYSQLLLQAKEALMNLQQELFCWWLWSSDLYILHWLVMFLNRNTVPWFAPCASTRLIQSWPSQRSFWQMAWRLDRDTPDVHLEIHSKYIVNN